jgi:hypothetical protein
MTEPELLDTLELNKPVFCCFDLYTRIYHLVEPDKAYCYKIRSGVTNGKRLFYHKTETNKDKQPKHKTWKFYKIMFLTPEETKIQKRRIKYYQYNKQEIIKLERIGVDFEFERLVNK